MHILLASFVLTLRSKNNEHTDNKLIRLIAMFKGSQSVQEFEVEDVRHEALFARYQALSHALQTTKLIGELTRALQQHRGATMGWLSGQHNFDQHITPLGSKISNLFILLNKLVKTDLDTQTIQQLGNIRNDWLTITLSWKKDQLMHNFEFHSHLIDSLLLLLRRECLQRIGAAKLSNASDLMTTPATYESLTLNDLPLATETLAQLRGLCTNVAVHKACAETNKAKIRYLLDMAVEQNRHLQQAKTESTTIEFPYGYQSQFRKFVKQIKNAILDADTIEVNSSSMFESSTAIIDQLWQIIDNSLQRIERKQLQQLAY